MELSGGGSGERARLSSDEDRLSALPNDILVLILLKLSSTRAAARTSVLGRSWRRVWALLPALTFDQTEADPGRPLVALDGHEVPVRSLEVGAHGAAAESLGVWLPAAARRVSGDLALYSAVRVSDRWDEDGEAPPQSGVFDLPCFDKATSVTLFLSFHGLAVPRAGVFARLAKLHLYRVWLHGPGELGDAVSSPRCPCLQRLTLDSARGLADLAIRSDTLLEVELRNLRSLSQLTVAAPALRASPAISPASRLQAMLHAPAAGAKQARIICWPTPQRQLVLFRSANPPVANISAPLMTNLDWGDKYDPRSVHLGKMPHLRSLGTSSYFVYGNYAFIDNYFLSSLLQRFEGIQTLSLTLLYLRDIANYQYLMEDLTMVPDITFLRLDIASNGHSFEASTFHVLGLCTGIRSLMLHFSLEVTALCSSDCICDNQPADWETEELLLNYLEEIEIAGWRGSEHEVAFLKRLLNWATRLKEMIVKFHFTISEIKAKELYQVFQSFYSRPGVCTKFYRFQIHRGMVLYAPED